MTDVSTAAPERVGESEPSRGRSIGSILRAFELDPRIFGMVVALLIIWVGFNILTGGTFLSARNLWNLSVQTATVAIMATGMVLIIVSRNIDLSVGSMLGAVGMAMALLQAEILPQWFGRGSPMIWIISLLVGILMGAAIGGLQGVIVAYVRVPAFIVTLGGLLVWRGVAWRLASGRTIAPMDSTFQLLGGGSRGTIGGVATWIVGAVACVGIVALLTSGRRRRLKYGFHLRPMWADIAVGIIGSAAVLVGVAVINSYPMPVNLARAYAEEQGIVWPEGGLEIPLGLANPVLIMIGVAMVMTFVATRLRFGRYVFAIGGNPEAAELGGIKTRWTIVKTFIVMGILVAIAAAVQVARLNAATSGLGTLAELYVIAAAVIGGTSLAGGIGSIPGAVLGALVAQSLQSGMVLMGVDAPIQDIVVGIVLVVAVALDTAYRRRVTDMTMTEAPTTTPLVELRDIRVAFGGVHAVDGVTIDLFPGEVVALVGGNGAGKTTLIKTLSGAHKADSGQVFVDGRAVTINNPRDARQYGIETIYQTLALADNIDAPSNIFLGREIRTKVGTLDDTAMEDATRKLMGRLNPRFENFVAPVASLSGGQRQSVAIARAVHFNARILIMDEPTAALGPAETEQVRELIRQLKKEGLGIFLISHDIHDVFDLADRISVMLQGKLVGTVEKAAVTMDEVLAMIIAGKLPGEVDPAELPELHG